MAERLVYVSRLANLPLLGADGAEIGRVADVVLGVPARAEAPNVHGFAIAVQRRRVFVSINRMAELAPDGVRLRRDSINMRDFAPRPGETLALGEIIGRRVGAERVADVGIRPAPEDVYDWEVATVALVGTGLFGGRRAPRLVGWDEAREAFGGEPLSREAAAITRLHPAEMAARLRELPIERRRALAAVMQDERLAELLAEIPEDEQVRIVEGLDLAHAARVLDEMAAEDAADLLGELPDIRRAQLLGAMDPEEAGPVRRLLGYKGDTAGGLMTPEPVIMPATAIVAEALARIREPRLSPALAAQVFVTAPPYETPTGRYRGLVGYQRLLQEPPMTPLARCLEEHPAPLPAGAPAREVAARLSAYDALAIPIIDPAGRLVGAVTVDDMLADLLPNAWRERRAQGA